MWRQGIAGYKWTRRNCANAGIVVAATVVLFTFVHLRGPYIKARLSVQETMRIDKAIQISSSRTLPSYLSLSSPPKTESPPPRDVKGEYKWINYDQIVNNMTRELEKTGWKIPKLTLGAHIRKEMPKFKQENGKPTVGPIKGFLDTAERRKIIHMGCFSNVKGANTLMAEGKTTKVTTFESCTNSCIARRRNYVAISEGNLCSCGLGVFPNVLSKNLNETDCNKKCKMERKGALRSCGGKKTTSIYRISGNAHEIITEECILHSSAGCFGAPDGLDFAFKKQSQIKKLVNCLLHCEKGRFPVAAWVNSDKCLCGMFTEKYPFSKLGNRINDSFCENSPQSTTESYVRIIRTFSEDERCDTRTFLPKSIGRLVAVVSFPGSGNTWVRHLIETATGFYTGSVYGDLALYKNGFIGEKLSWNSRMTSVIKTHRPDTADIFEESLLIIRNPFDAMIAEFNRVRSGHVGLAEPEMFNTTEWLYFMILNGRKWFHTIETYTSMKTFLIVYYEDIVENAIREVRKMVKFLHYPVQNQEERLQCLESNLSGNFKRPKRTLGFDPFPPKYKEMINTYIRTARKVLAAKKIILPKYEKL